MNMEQSRGLHISTAAIMIIVYTTTIKQILPRLHVICITVAPIFIVSFVWWTMIIEASNAVQLQSKKEFIIVMGFIHVDMSDNWLRSTMHKIKDPACQVVLPPAKVSLCTTTHLPSYIS